MGWIGRSWRGEEALWKVFWLYGVLLSIGLTIVDAFTRHAIHRHLGLTGGVVYLVGIGVFWYCYYWWLIVSEWRCAFNAEWVIFSYIIKVLSGIAIIITILGTIFLSFKLLDVVLSKKFSIRYVDAFFSCGDEENIKLSDKNNADKKEVFDSCLKRKLEESATDQNASAPVAPVVAPPKEKPSWDSYYIDACKKTMTETANKAGVDPQSYIDQNQDFLNKCVNYYKAH